MNVFWQELKMMKNLMIVWVIVLVALVLVYISLYPAFSRDVETVKSLFTNIPPAIRDAVHLSDQAFLTFLGFFAFTFTQLTLAAGIYAMHLGISVLSREPRSKTTDFLMTKPKGRATLFMQKFLAGLTAIVLVWLATVGASFELAKLFGEGDFPVDRFVLLMLALLLVQLWLYSFGLAISQLLRQVKSTISVTLAVTFGFFIINILGGMLHEQSLRYLSPFSFFNYQDIAAGKGIELSFLLAATATMISAVTVAYVIYTKRDVRAAA